MTDYGVDSDTIVDAVWDLIEAILKAIWDFDTHGGLIPAFWDFFWGGILDGTLLYVGFIIALSGGVIVAIKRMRDR